jgi:hypothetical protein
MPEAPVHEDDSLMLRKDDIRASRKICAVDAKPKTKAMSGFPRENFGGRVLAFDGPHVRGPLLAS